MFVSNLDCPVSKECCCDVFESLHRRQDFAFFFGTRSSSHFFSFTPGKNSVLLVQFGGRVGLSRFEFTEDLKVVDVKSPLLGVLV
jgi:hypothetical protein